MIVQNKDGMWQFHIYAKNVRRYVKKLLRVEEQAHAEDLQIQMRTNIKLGKSFFDISIKEGVSSYLVYGKHDIGIAVVGIVESS